MAIKSIQKIGLRKKQSKRKAEGHIPSIVKTLHRFSREEDLKKKYKTSKEDLLHLFV